MTRPQTDPPTEWSGLDLLDVGGGIYVFVGSEQKVGAKAEHVLVYHWHTPKDGHARWQLTRCGLHTVDSLDPLTMHDSLACDEGCPNHGYIENGSWRSV